MNSTVKTVVFWVLIATCLIVLWHVVESGVGMGKDAEIPFSKFMSDAQGGQIADVTVVGSEVHGHYRTGKENFHTIVP
ncbi:MAG TPA: ATP-dependent metallopeptidase FtsH/Yme1/Tma family protein, partial [Acidobacteriaceae bacterium]|nr:ATP-dependent metallopeptidase FtsH/Yme1/Tma family protein [Acidobacteriaceae bacterium]